MVAAVLDRDLPDLLPGTQGRSTGRATEEAGEVLAQAVAPKLQERTVTVKAKAKVEGKRVEIKSGLSGSDRVVVKGAPFIKDGDKVQVIGN